MVERITNQFARSKPISKSRFKPIVDALTIDPAAYRASEPEDTAEVVARIIEDLEKDAIHRRR